MWDRHVPQLAGRFRAIRYDTRGFGRSESDHVSFSNGADAIAVLDYLGVERAVIVGVSRGAIIALDAAIEFPERVAGLVWVAGGVSGYEPEERSVGDEVWEEVEQRSTNKEWEWLADFETHYWVDGPGRAEDRVDPALRSMVRGWILDTYRAEKEEGLPVPLDPPADGRLGELAVPVMVVVGALDEAGTVASGYHLAAAVPQARLEVFEAAAHMLALEEPERFTSLLADFASTA